MTVRSESDWVGLREASRVVRLTLDALEARVEPGITTAELDRIAAGIFAEHGARSAPSLVYGFPGEVLISVNDEVVHGVPGPRRLARGDLVKLDVTVEKDGYVADAARSVVVPPGVVLAERLRTCAEAALQAALGVMRVGRRVNAIGAAVEEMVRRHGFTVIRSLAGHGVGRTIHEAPSVPNYCDRRQLGVLTAGLVLAIEPIISAGGGRVVESPDGWTLRTRDGSWAAHHEHTVVVTHQGPVVLTAAA